MHVVFVVVSYLSALSLVNMSVFLFSQFGSFYSLFVSFPATWIRNLHSTDISLSLSTYITPFHFPFLYAFLQFWCFSACHSLQYSFVFLSIFIYVFLYRIFHFTLIRPWFLTPYFALPLHLTRSLYLSSFLTPISLILCPAFSRADLASSLFHPFHVSRSFCHLNAPATRWVDSSSELFPRFSVPTGITGKRKIRVVHTDDCSCYFCQEVLWWTWWMGKR